MLADGSFVGVLPEDADAAGDEEAAGTIQRNRMPNRVSELHVVQNFFEELKARVPN